MDLTDAFVELQKTADADPDEVAEARRRRDLFRDAFDGDADPGPDADCRPDYCLRDVLHAQWTATVA